VLSLWGALAAACSPGSALGAVPASFGEEGEGVGQFKNPVGIAVNQETGELFVVDRENLRVERWGGEGAFERTWGAGVNAGTGGNLCIAGESCEAGEPGAGAGAFAGFPAGVAVDNSLGMSQGDVYVVDDSNHRVQEFSPDGQFLLTFGKGVNGATHGNVCTAAETASCRAGEASSAPGAFAVLEDNDVAVDSSGVVYVGDQNRIEEFDSSGAFVKEVPLPGVGVVRGIAVDSAKDIYVVGEFAGVRKYDLAGVELGAPRDPLARLPVIVDIAVGPSDELFVYDGAQGHVEEFDANGNQTGSFVQGGFALGLAFRNALDALYVLLSGEVSVLALPPAGPVVVTGSERVERALPQSATVCATVNREGTESAKAFFEYGTSTAYGSSTSPHALGGEAFEDQQVCAELSGLSPESEYHFRVVVEGGGHQTVGPDAAFTTTPAVSVEAESVSHVSGSGARLEASLNPHGVAARFHFEYGTTSGYEHSAPLPDGPVAASSEAVEVNVVVQGLQPETVYHYRVVARSSLGTVAGPDRTFRTQGTPVTALADGRAWEMVSPPSKHGSALESMAEEGADIQAAEDGHALTYVAKAPIGPESPGTRSSANTQLLSTRNGPGSWSTLDITTPHEAVAGLTVGIASEYQLFSSDLSQAGVEPFGATPLNPGLMGARHERTPYRRESNGEFLPLATEANTPEGVRFGGHEESFGEFSGGVHFVSMTPDASKIIVRSPQPLEEGVAPSESAAENLYEWKGGRLTLVSRMPSERPATEEGLPAGLGNTDRQVRGAVSDDGSRIVFEAGDSTVHLYVRDVGRGETVQLDVPQPGVRSSRGGPIFQIASSDGSRVFFTDPARLTTDSTAREGSSDLYMCEVRVVEGHLSCSLSDLTVDRNRNESAEVLGDVIGIDRSARFVYFVANGALAPGAVHGGCGEVAPASASCNLYVRDVDSGKTSLVAVLAGSDHPDWQALPVGTNLTEMTAGVSPSGRYLAFMSSRPLTEFDNRDAVNGEHDVEVFEFDREAGTLACVSCERSGARPAGVFDTPEFPGLLVDRGREWAGQWLAGSIPGWTQVEKDRALYRSRYLSNSGRLFFDSPVGLVAGDENGSEDVYEFEPGGVGGCGLASGCVALMSSGTSNEESAFLDASGSGDDMFFLTAARLSPADVDDVLDVYDAHVCSAHAPCPSGAPSAPPPCTTADSCRAAPAAQPDVFGAPASQLFSGSGNATPSPAPRPVKPKAKALSRAQKLARALRACQRKPRRQRAACRARARRLYGPKHRPAGRHARRASAGGRRR
jgi:hypothetical protein